MKKIKLFSVKRNRTIEGVDGELYFDLYLAFDKEIIFTFIIQSPNLSCSGKNLIKLIKRWIMLIEEEYIKYMQRYYAK